MRLGRLPALLGLLLCAACGSVAVTRLARDSDYREGIRFYRPQPYLLVSAKGADRAAQVVWLPKKDEEYVLRVRSGMGSVDAKFALQDGWNLTEYGESRTPETSDLIGAAAGVAKAAEALVGGPRGELEPGLYAIEFDPATGLASRLRRVDLSVEGAK